MANLANKFRAKDLEDLESFPLSYLISNSSGNGVYLYSLVSYLIRLHNDFIEFYLNFKNDISKSKINLESFNRVELENLNINDCINFSVDKEILQIVYTHSNYSLENVQETNLEYNFVKIQQTIDNRFFLDKPLINNKVDQSKTSKKNLLFLFILLDFFLRRLQRLNILMTLRT